MNYIGRTHELNLLRQTVSSTRAKLIAVYGRRRVGKTALVEEAFKNQRLWKFEGLEGGSTQQQIRHFMLTLSTYLPKPIETPVKTWEEAFLQLEKLLGDNPPVLFFDEFQWMASETGQFVSIFKWAWDNIFSKRKSLQLVLCGSVSSFIVKKVIRSKALYGRVDLEIHLKPLSINEVHQLYQGKKHPQEILALYMIVGGIPQYHVVLNPEKSWVQNIGMLAFTPHGYFIEEYRRLFISHFSNTKHYESILRTLSLKGWMGTDELAKALGISTGGTLTSLLEDLELAGFIERTPPFNKGPNSRQIKNRLSDEFLNFYFSFVEPEKLNIERGRIQGFDVLTGPKFDQWRGYAFERLCQKHHSDIARALGFHGIRYHAGPWFQKDETTTFQIDLIFDRADKVMTICELKAVQNLNAQNLTSQIDRNVGFLKTKFRRSFQKILVLADRISTPQNISTQFDDILFAEDIFFEPKR